MQHSLKADTDSYDAIVAGHKTLELRRDDRGYLVGDTLRLHRYEEGEPTGDQVTVLVTHIVGGKLGVRYGLQSGFVAMSIEVV